MLERLTHQARGLTRERGTCVRRRTIESVDCRRRSPMLDVGGDFGWPACLGRVNWQDATLFRPRVPRENFDAEKWGQKRLLIGWWCNGNWPRCLEPIEQCTRTWLRIDQANGHKSHSLPYSHLVHALCRLLDRLETDNLQSLLGKGIN